MRSRRARGPGILLALLVLCALAGSTAGCGGDELEQRRQQIEERAHDLEARARRLRDRARELRQRVRAALDDLKQAVPEATERTQAPRTRGRTQAGTIDEFLTTVLTSVDAYWSRTLRAAGRPEPRVAYEWLDDGERVPTGCDVVADDSAAFYCTRDDTIYVAQRFAAELFQGIKSDLPGQRAGYGRAAGDFGVAYVVAHEYAHNLQHELDLYTLRPQIGSKPFELQADCLAGAWGNSVYQEGLLQPGDVQEAIDTASAVGDFDFTGPDHHGTPQERRAAWELGFRSGDPNRCARYVPTV